MNKFKAFFKELVKTRSFIAVVSSLISISIGLGFGLILLVVLKPGDSLYGFNQIIFGAVSNLNKIGQVLYMAMPLIMTGLAVGFAFKTGLFNIGASGQFLLGGFLALLFALLFKMPWWLCLIMSAIGGAIWGAIPGIFKALLNVNEVITSIMFNWIGLFMVNVIVANIPKMLGSYYSGTSERTANIARVNSSGLLPKLGLNNLFDNNSVSIGILLACIIAIIIYIILNKTIFGYELKACGYNKNASRYAGINEKRNIILSMTIAGCLAGIGGGLYYLNGGVNYVIEKALPAMGFNGIPVALLGHSNPIGIIFSALFISYIQVGGEGMQPEFSSEVVNIIISVIIYVSAFALIFKEIIARIRLKKNKDLEVKTVEGGDK